MPWRYQGCPGSIGGDELGENGGSWGIGFIRRFSLESSYARETGPYEPYAPTTTVLAQFVASYRTRAFLISPRHALRAPLLGCAYRWPGDGSAISRQSRCARFNLDAGEIASRLQIRHQVTYRRSRVAERAEHAPEISGLPGFGRWRRSRRNLGENGGVWRMGYNGPVCRVAHRAFERKSAV